jgi:hypothetical protein
VEGGKGGKEGTGISFDVRKLFRSEKVSLMKYSRFANTCHLTLATYPTYIIVFPGVIHAKNHFFWLLFFRLRKGVL